MTLQPGSLPWLLRHEVRLQWRGRQHKLLSSIGTVGILALLHVLAIPFAYLMPLSKHLSTQLQLASVSALLWFVGLGMCSRALSLAVHAAYERGDVDLLLSSPLPPRITLAARSAAIVWTLVYEVASLVLPFANVFALFGHVQWLLAYLVLPGLALLAASVGLWLSMFLFRWLGARRTRITSQVFAALLGSSSVMLSLLPALFSEKGDTGSALRWLWMLPEADSPFWWPARAALGDPLVAAIAAPSIVAIFALSVYAAAPRFIENMVASASVGTSGRKRSSARMPRFRGGVQRVLVTKELRLLARDPWLITQVLQQNIYVVPLLIGIWREASPGFGFAWIAVVMAACTVAGALAWLAGAGESAPDLLQSAPIRPRDSLRAKLTAALLPVAAALCIPIAILAASRPWTALAIAIGSVGGALCCALLNIYIPRPNKSRNLRERYKNNLRFSLLELMVTLAWSGVALLLMWLQR